MPILLIIAGAAIIYFLKSFLYKRGWFKGLETNVAFQNKPAVEGDQRLKFPLAG